MAESASQNTAGDTDRKMAANQRTVSLQRQQKGRYLATNVRGGTISIGTGEDEDFTPVELLLAAIAGCSAVDVDFITGKRAEPQTFSATSSGTKTDDELGNRLTGLLLDFDVSFADDEGGRQAAAVLERAIKQSHDRLCTVGRTIEAGTPMTAALQGRQISG
ncbi:osmotically inducible protein C [Microlunatus endophyticus]|uniref:Osmotically inducible protein C n=1 Tax=Microlunatus endophyticus TaxID=1716077 RepID=A0A917SD80_9ACTN|nr:OsmC family protein [Microlunatus endophyticus]GGL70925.1 osmotically inducible protein C [Microlunatus endophyticus]